MLNVIIALIKYADNYQRCCQLELTRSTIVLNEQIFILITGGFI